MKTEAGQEPNAKARFKAIPDKQSEEIALDRLCAAFGIQRVLVKTLDDFISVMQLRERPEPREAEPEPKTKQARKPPLDVRLSDGVQELEQRELFQREIPADYKDLPNGSQILSQALRLAGFLMRKNRDYGDSALRPVRVFSKAEPIEQIRVRMDDKLSRLVRGQAGGEDAMLDLVGYYFLLKIAEEEQSDGQ